jgi:hypothetical protein
MEDEDGSLSVVLAALLSGSRLRLPGDLLNTVMQGICSLDLGDRDASALLHLIFPMALLPRHLDTVDTLHIDLVLQYSQI